jgi:hypothetical protein
VCRHAAAGSQPGHGGGPEPAAFPALEAAWAAQRACLGSGERYELAEPLLALQRTLARVLRMPRAEAATLLCAARAARRAGRLTHAMAALHDLQATLRRAPANPNNCVLAGAELCRCYPLQGGILTLLRLGDILLPRVLGDVLACVIH